MNLNLKKSEILLTSKIGFEFEFYSNHDLQKTVTLLSRELNKKISIETKAHSDFKPTADHFKVEPDMSGGAKLIELVTGSLPYQDARIVMIKVLKWIKENGKTGDRCGIHMNISYNPDICGDTFLSHINVLKFILEFDEAFVYKLFPKREGLVYAKSIKFIVPRERYQFSDIKHVNPNNFIFPSEKYYGVNFQKLMKNYLEFRYLGGDKYENRTSDLLELLDHFVLQLFNVAKDPNLTDENYEQLRKILKKYEHLSKAYLSFVEFKRYYPTVGFLVDLDSDDRRINTYWPVIRDRMFNLLNECNLKDGIINYNSDTNKLQIKDANLTDSFKIESVELVSCKVRGIIRDCDLFRCDVENAEMYNCNIFNESKIKGAKIENSYTNVTCLLTDCYVYGKKTLMNGKMVGGVFREGRVTNMSQFDGTEKVEFEKIKTRIDVRH